MAEISSEKEQAPVKRPLRYDHPHVGFTQYEVVNTSEYCGKIIIQKGGTTVPAHCHKLKHETFLVWSGRVKMIVEDRSFVMNSGDVVSIDRDTIHEFTALDDDAVLIEFSTSSTPSDSYFVQKDMWNKVNHRSKATIDYDWADVSPATII